MREAACHSSSLDLGELLLEVLRRWPREADASRNHMLHVAYNPNPNPNPDPDPNPRPLTLILA